MNNFKKLIENYKISNVVDRIEFENSDNKFTFLAQLESYLNEIGLKNNNVYFSYSLGIDPQIWMFKNEHLDKLKELGLNFDDINLGNDSELWNVINSKKNEEHDKPNDKYNGISFYEKYKEVYEQFKSQGYISFKEPENIRDTDSILSFY